MNFQLSEDLLAIRDAAEDALRDLSASSAVRALMSSAPDARVAAESSLWRTLTQDLGWGGIAIAERHDGLGLGPIALVLIQEQAGRRLLCAPYFSTVCMAATIMTYCADDAAQNRCLPGIASGALRVAIALPSDPEKWLSGEGFRADASAAGWMLEGSAPSVVGMTGADQLLVAARVGDDQVGLFMLPAVSDAMTVTTRARWDGSRELATITLNQPVVALRIDDPSRFAEGRATSLALAQLYLSAELLGH